MWSQILTALRNLKTVHGKAAEVSKSIFESEEKLRPKFRRSILLYMHAWLPACSPSTSLIKMSSSLGSTAFPLLSSRSLLPPSMSIGSSGFISISETEAHIQVSCVHFTLDLFAPCRVISP